MKKAHQLERKIEILANFNVDLPFRHQSGHARQITGLFNKLLGRMGQNLAFK
jgi:hypothetical protein